MPQKNVQLRAASPYERRLAIREELGYYNCLAIGAVYEFADPKFDVRSAHSFVRPLKTAIEKYAYMSVVLKGTDTESPVWERVPKINLDDHIIMQDEVTNDDELSTIQKTFNNLVSIRMNGPLPPWRFSVLPLSPKNGKPRAFVAFALSHSIGDGGAGIAFKQTFLEALRQPWSPDNNLDFAVPDRQLPEPSDTPERLPVSPEFVKSVSSSSVVGAGTWTGSKVFADEGAVQTKVRIVEIEPQHVKAALHASRVHGTKLTPILHHFIVRALSKVIVDKNVKDFASTTAYDLRGASGVGSEWGIYISGLSASHPRANLSNFISEDQWQYARDFSKKLADASSTLNDQVLGMLRFIPNQKESMTSKIGTTREASYAVSNMLTFDGGNPGDSVRMTNLAVVSSAAVPSAPINFLFISIKNGSMMCTINWQPGALGVPLEEEDSFMDRICLSVKADFASFEQIDKALRARL